MKKELLTDALGTLDADIIGDYLATEKKLKKRRAKRRVSVVSAERSAGVRRYSFLYAPSFVCGLCRLW